MQPTFQAWAVSQMDINKQATANAMALSFMDLGQALVSCNAWICCRANGL